MENGVLLTTQLQNGYRMAKPEFAPSFIGEMMKNCWQKVPKDRPTFSQMADVIAKQIEFVVGTDYLNLNGEEYEKCLIREIVNPTRTSRLGIVKLLNETKTKSPSPRKEKQSVTFFGGPP